MSNKKLPYKMYSIIVYRNNILEKVCFETIKNVEIDDKVDYKFIEKSIASFALFNDEIQEFLFRNFCNRYFNDPKIIEIANIAIENEPTYKDEVSMILVVELKSIPKALNYDYQLRIKFVKDENDMLNVTKSNLSNDYSNIERKNISHLYEL